MTETEQICVRLSDLLNDPDAGNDDIRNAALEVRDLIETGEVILNGTNYSANLVALTSALTLLNPERWAYTIAAIDEIIPVATLFTQAESELVRDCWDGGNWDEAVGQVVREFDQATDDLDDAGLMQMCRKAIARGNPSSGVTCKFCGERTLADLAHLHAGEYVGECCWDERLRATE